MGWRGLLGKDRLNWDMGVGWNGILVLGNRTVGLEGADLIA